MKHLKFPYNNQHTNYQDVILIPNLEIDLCMWSIHSIFHIHCKMNLHVLQNSNETADTQAAGRNQRLTQKSREKNTVAISCWTPKFSIKCSFLPLCQFLLLTSSNSLCGDTKGSVHSHSSPKSAMRSAFRNPGKLLAFLRISQKYELTSSLMQKEN